MEVNQIQNLELKTKICDYTISLLVSQNLMKLDEMKDVTITFGYLFTKEDGVLEGLLCAKLYNNVFYVALQNEKLLLLTIDENQYQQTVDYMINTHECLK